MPAMSTGWNLHGQRSPRVTCKWPFSLYLNTMGREFVQVGEQVGKGNIAVEGRCRRQWAVGKYLRLGLPMSR